MKNCIETIMDRLKAQVPELRHIDMNLGQMNMENPPVDYPCALIDVTDIRYSQTGQGGQVGTATIDIELFFSVNSPSNMSAPNSVRTQAMAHFDIVKKVYTSLEGLSGDNFSGLSRLGLKRNAQYFPRAFTLAFQSAIYENTARPSYRKLTDVKPDISA